MSKFTNFNLLRLIFLFVIILIFNGINFGLAKGMLQKKPKCNYNGICEKNESSSCPDCQQQPSAPLQLDHDGLQIVSGSGMDDRKVYHIKWIEGEYDNTWRSNENDHITRASGIGDVDNDGYKEIITAVNYKKSTGPPKKRISYQKIFVYEDGSEGDPNYASHDLGHSLNGVRDLIIADADNDDLNEIVLVKNKHIEIYEWNGSGFIHLWSGPEYDSFIWSVDVGDADNDGTNEIVLAMFSMGSAIVYEYLGDNTWGNPAAAQSIGTCNIDYAKVRDADNDGLNEIIGGGTSNGLNVWKYIDGAYVNVFLSEDLGGFTQGVDAGDIDGDGLNEVIVGTSSGTNDDMIYVFEYDFVNDSYEIIDSIACAGVECISVGDVDGDGVDEIVVATEGITVFKIIDGLLKRVYNFLYGGYLEIG